MTEDVAQRPQGTRPIRVLDYASSTSRLPLIIRVLAVISILWGIHDLWRTHASWLDQTRLVARSSATVGWVPVPKAKSFAPVDVQLITASLETVAHLTEAQKTQVIGLVASSGPSMYPELTAPVTQADLVRQRIVAEFGCAEPLKGTHVYIAVRSDDKMY